MAENREAESEIALKNRIAKSLKGFEKGNPEDLDESRIVSHNPPPELFPVPELVLFTLRNILGFPATGMEEKVRWTVYAEVSGRPFAFSLQKFGFRIFTLANTPHELTIRVSRQLSASLKHVDAPLSSYAESQIYSGNLTIQNKMHLFDERYTYFRNIADQEYSNTKISAAAQGANQEDFKSLFNNLREIINNHSQSERRGFFASSAMIDAWFSRLEHRMLLLRAFSGIPLEPGGLKLFLNSPWDERLRFLLPSRTDNHTGVIIGKLRKVKETLRNPISHGGVENDGGAFHFHLDGIGAIPANLSRYSGGLKPSLVPIPEITHSETCTTFDQADDLLNSGNLKLPGEFISNGIDPHYDVESISQYRESIEEGEESVSQFIEAISRNWEMHANMDY